MARTARRLAPTATCLLLVGAGRVVAWAVAAPIEAARTGRATFDDLVALTAGVGGALVLTYVVLLLSLTAATAVPGSVGRLAESVAGRLTPAALRGAVQVALGAGLVTGSVAAAALPAAATQPAATPTAATSAPSTAGPRMASSDDVAALPPIGRPGGSAGWSATAPPPAAEPAPRAPREPAAALLAAAPRERDVAASVDEVVVRRGDTLWALAARALGPDATDAEVAAEWPRWFAANRAAVGDDPDLILPGTVLRAPGQL